MRKLGQFFHPAGIQRLPIWILWVSLIGIGGILAAGLLLRIDISVSIEGQTRPENFAEIRAKSQGVIREILVEENQWVEAGEPVAVLYNTEVKYQRLLAALEKEKAEWEVKKLLAEFKLTQERNAAQIEQSSARIEQVGNELDLMRKGTHPKEIERARAELKRARQTLELNEKEARQGEILYQKGAITEREYEVRQTNLKQAQETVKAEEANLEYLMTRIREENIKAKLAELEVVSGIHKEAVAGRWLVDLKKAELEETKKFAAEASVRARQAEENYENTILRAPISGRILSSDLEMLVGVGVSPGYPVLNVGSLDTMLVRCRVPESKYADVEEGMKAKVFVEAFPHVRFKVFEGEVVRISPFFQTIDWEALGIPKEEVTPEMREAFTFVYVKLKEPYVVTRKNIKKELVPGLRARVDLLLDEGPALFVLLRYLKRSYKQIPNVNIHF